MTQAMTTKDARRAPARAVSSFPLSCKGSKRSRGVPRHQAKVSISVQQDQDQEDYKTEVIMEPKTASPLVVPLPISPPLLAPFPLDIWEEDQGLYK